MDADSKRDGAIKALANNWNRGVLQPKSLRLEPDRICRWIVLRYTRAPLVVNVPPYGQANQGPYPANPQVPYSHPPRMVPPPRTQENQGYNMGMLNQIPMGTQPVNPIGQSAGNNIMITDMEKINIERSDFENAPANN